MIGVQAAGAPAVYESWKSHTLRAAGIDTAAEGLATGAAYHPALRTMIDHLDDFVLVSEEEIRGAMLLLARGAHVIAEEAGAAATAGAVQLQKRLRGLREHTLNYLYHTFVGLKYRAEKAVQGLMPYCYEFSSRRLWRAWVSETRSVLTLSPPSFIGLSLLGSPWATLPRPGPPKVGRPRPATAKASEETDQGLHKSSSTRVIWVDYRPLRHPVFCPVYIDRMVFTMSLSMVSHPSQGCFRWV